MGRLVYPSDFAGQKTLTDNIATKHTADGAASPLKPYLDQQGITMASLTVAGTKATQQDVQSKLLHRQAENYTQQRDLAFGPVLDAVKASTQFLKSLYRSQPKVLGDWGIQITDGGRVVWPSDFVALQGVAVAFLKKHATYPAGQSPLLPYIAEHALDPAALMTAADKALIKHKSFAQTAKDAEEATQNRNNTWAPAWAAVQGIGDYLMKLYNGAQKKLGEWGFVVDDSPKAARPRTTVLKLGEGKTITSVLIGSTIENKGDTDLHLYRGKTTVGTPVILKKGEATGVQKGWSTITVVNPDGLKSGKVQAVITGS